MKTGGVVIDFGEYGTFISFAGEKYPMQEIANVANVAASMRSNKKWLILTGHGDSGKFEFKQPRKNKKPKSKDLYPSALLDILTNFHLDLLKNAEVIFFDTCQPARTKKVGKPSYAAQFRTELAAWGMEKNISEASTPVLAFSDNIESYEPDPPYEEYKFVDYTVDPLIESGSKKRGKGLLHLYMPNGDEHIINPPRKTFSPRKIVSQRVSEGKEFGAFPDLPFDIPEQPLRKLDNVIVYTALPEPKSTDSPNYPK